MGRIQDSTGTSKTREDRIPTISLRGGCKQKLTSPKSFVCLSPCVYTPSEVPIAATKYIGLVDMISHIQYDGLSFGHRRVGEGHHTPGHIAKFYIYPNERAPGAPHSIFPRFEFALEMNLLRKVVRNSETLPYAHVNFHERDGNITLSNLKPSHHPPPRPLPSRSRNQPLPPSPQPPSARPSTSARDFSRPQTFAAKLLHNSLDLRPLPHLSNLRIAKTTGTKLHPFSAAINRVWRGDVQPTLNVTVHSSFTNDDIRI